MRRRRGRAASGCLSGETVVGSAAMKRMGEHEAPEAAPGGLTVCVLASGSKGNAIYLSDGRTALLVDAGLAANGRGVVPDHRRFGMRVGCCGGRVAIIVI